MKKQRNSFLHITKYDIIILAAVLFISTVFTGIRSFRKGRLVTATVIYDGNTVYSAVLSDKNEEASITPKDGVTITVKNGRIGFTESSCKTHECVKCGMISKTHETAVCLPNKIIIVLSASGNTSDGYDAVVY